ncbi:MAG: S53 family peptidase [Nitrolancea sp.]
MEGWVQTSASQALFAWTEPYGKGGTMMFRRVLTILALVSLIAIPLNVQVAFAAPSGRAKLSGNVPPWATSANFKSSADGSSDIGFRVYLDWQNQSALESLAAAVSDPANKSYGQYLSPQQFHKQFAPSQQSVNAVTSWLRGQGFKIVYTPNNNLYVSAEGTVAQAAAAFGTSFGMYQVEGISLRSPSSDISMPSSIAPLVSGVIGLDDSAQLVHTNIANDPSAPPAPAFVSAKPCSAYWGEQAATDFSNPYGAGDLAYIPCGYTPQQILGAYGLANSGYDGSGQTVAIIDAYASPTIQQDLDQWSSNRDLPSTTIQQIVAPGTYHHPERGQFQDPQGWYGEETLDIEAVHGMAPQAHIIYVGAPNNFQDLDAALNHVVDKHLASIVTNSYGWNSELLPPGFIKPFNQILMQGAAEGIGIYFSSGDNSDESQTVGYVSADFPASSPWVTAVGGTSLAVGADNNYLFETGWGTSKSSWTDGAWSPTPPGTWIYGGGGGVSRIFPEPSYQVGVVPQSVFDAQKRTGRAVPDISMDGDPNTGYLIGQTQTFPDGTIQYSEYRLGGTSLSSPLMAGVMALVNQAAGTPLGFVNPLLYERVAGTSAVHDVVDPSSTVAGVRADYANSVDDSDGLVYSLRTFNQTLSLDTTPGYDDVTGIGSPAPGFIDLLSSP